MQLLAPRERDVIPREREREKESVAIAAAAVVASISLRRCHRRVFLSLLRSLSSSRHAG
jgi:hypothetical protein